MYPQSYGPLAHARRNALHTAAISARLAAAATERRRAERHAIPPAWREAVGFGLVEAGLRVAVGRGGHPPRPPVSAALSRSTR